MVNQNLQVNEVGNGVICNGNFYPYKFCAINAALTMTCNLNSRIYLKRVELYARMIAADTTTYLNVLGTQNFGVYSIGFLEIVPSVAAAYSFIAEKNILLDKGATITLTAGVANPTHFVAICIYAEIDDI